MRCLLLLIALFLSTGVSASIQVEADFLEKMSEHHQSGIKMSSLALEKAQNEKIKKLAKKMRDDQAREQEQMQELKAKWYKEIKVPKDNMASVNTTQLENKSGNEFDKNFLEMMTKHHKEGIEMMGKMLPNIEKREIHRMALKMTKKQGQEIGKMERLQKTIK